MSDIQMGTLKPAYLAKAANLDSNSMLHAYMGSKAKAMSRHPASGSRRSQFNAQADLHLGQQANNAGEASTIKAAPSGSMPASRSAQFAENATMN